MTAVHRPWPVDQPVDHPWATRAELPGARAEAVPRLERRLLSLRRSGGHLPAVVVAGCGAAGGAFIQEWDDGAGMAVLVLLAAACGWVSTWPSPARGS